MKKRTCIFLAAALCLTLCGCGAAPSASSASAPAASAPAASSEAAALAEAQAENQRLTAENETLRTQLASAQSGTAAAADTDPIDAFFAPYESAAETTAAMAAVGSAKYDAWHDELKAFVQDLESETSDAQDRKDLENYLQNAEAQAQILTQVVYLEGAGADTPRADRPGSAGSLAPVSIAQGGAEIFRQAFLRLWDVRYAEESDWTWHFDAAAAKTALDTALAG